MEGLSVVEELQKGQRATTEGLGQFMLPHATLQPPLRALFPNLGNMGWIKHFHV